MLATKDSSVVLYPEFTNRLHVRVRHKVGKELARFSRQLVIERHDS